MLTLIHQIIAVLFGMAVAFVTLAPMTGSNRWWIRGWDFPRAQIAALAALTALIAVPLGGWIGWLVLGVALICGAYQAWRIFPFTPLAPEDIAIQNQRDDDVHCVAMNVEMINDDFEAVRQVVRDEDPDILFLMEMNQTWTDEMEEVLERYDTVVRIPQDNYYGLVWATRLKVRDVETVQLTIEKTPTLFAVMEDRSGRVFRFIGMHPKPPVPGVDTEERDAQTLYAARFARETPEPVVVMGDFNDAVWSDTAQLFKKAGEYVDVRAGRGFYSSFHARYWWFRCPIDQLYLTEGVALTRFEIGPYVGSDHFPVIAHVNLDSDLADTDLKNPTKLSDADRKEINDAIATHRARLIETASDD